MDCGEPMVGREDDAVAREAKYLGRDRHICLLGGGGSSRYERTGAAARPVLIQQTAGRFLRQNSYFSPRLARYGGADERHSAISGRRRRGDQRPSAAAAGMAWGRGRRATLAMTDDAADSHRWFATFEERGSLFGRREGDSLLRKKGKASRLVIYHA